MLLITIVYIQLPKIITESLRKMQKEVAQNESIKKAPKSNNLTSRTITVTDAYGNKIQKQVLVDDQGNIIDEYDVEYVEESYIDEFGNTGTRMVPKIKAESLRRKQRSCTK